MAAFDVCNVPVAPISDWQTRAFVVAKKGTVANTAPTPDIETKVEGMNL